MINALAERVFDRLDDQTRLSEHMNKRSWKLGWGRMETVLDAQQGRSVGSHIVIRGRVFRVRLYLDEVVAMREPQLLVIGPYRMGFDLTLEGSTAKRGKSPRISYSTRGSPPHRRSGTECTAMT